MKPTKTFTKPSQSCAQLLARMKSRGLIVTNQRAAVKQLQNISYYRLSGYTRYFQINSVTHRFKPGTTFANIINLYTFDRRLRLLVMDALERVEVAIRVQICDTLCESTGDAFWHLKSQYFVDEPEHYEEILNKLRNRIREERRQAVRELASFGFENTEALEDYVKSADVAYKIQQILKLNPFRHYACTYSEPELPPAWMIMDELSMGDLSWLYQELRSEYVKKKIAGHFQVEAHTFGGWLYTLNNLRNICAHHGRLWNVYHRHATKIPDTDNTPWLSYVVMRRQGELEFEHSTYSMLVVLQSLLYITYPESQWAIRLKNLVEEYSEVKLRDMGMPEHWYKDPFWQKALKGD